MTNNISQSLITSMLDLSLKLPRMVNNSAFTAVDVSRLLKGFCVHNSQLCSEPSFYRLGPRHWHLYIDLPLAGERFQPAYYHRGDTSGIVNAQWLMDIMLKWLSAIGADYHCTYLAYLIETVILYLHYVKSHCGQYVSYTHNDFGMTKNILHDIQPGTQKYEYLSNKDQALVRILMKRMYRSSVRAHRIHYLRSSKQMSWAISDGGDIYVISDGKYLTQWAANLMKNRKSWKLDHLLAQAIMHIRNPKRYYVMSLSSHFGHVHKASRKQIKLMQLEQVKVKRSDDVAIVHYDNQKIDRITRSIKRR